MILASDDRPVWGYDVAVDGDGRVLQLPGVSYLRRDRADQVLEDMLTGWRRQQLARNLSMSTIHTRAQVVDRFIARSTVRSYQNALSLFCAYLADPGYGWDTLCEKEFGSHPSQVCFEWNTAAHTQDNEQDPTKRAFTRDELQAFFDRADDEVSRIRDLGRKGWLPAFRDAVLFKVAYGWGLRRNEVRHLQTVDFSRNPHAPEFGRHGVLNVRYGKANAGSAHKRRSVLTVMGWTAETAAHWIEKGLPQFGDGLDLFPSERGTLVSEAALGARFRRYRDDLALDEGLDIHSFRRFLSA